MWGEKRGCGTVKQGQENAENNGRQVLQDSHLLDLPVAKERERKKERKMSDSYQAIIRAIKGRYQG